MPHQGVLVATLLGALAACAPTTAPEAELIRWEDAVGRPPAASAEADTPDPTCAASPRWEGGAAAPDFAPTWTPITVSSNSVRCLIFEDLDIDGFDDIAWVSEEGMLTIRWGMDGASFSGGARLDLGAGVVGACTVGDVDGDGDGDLLVADDTKVRLVQLDGRDVRLGPHVLEVPRRRRGEEKNITSLTWMDLGDGMSDSLLVGAHVNDHGHSCDERDPNSSDPFVLRPSAPTYGQIYCYRLDPEAGGWVQARGMCPERIITEQTGHPFGAVVGDVDDDGTTDAVLIVDGAKNITLLGGDDGLHHSMSGLETYDHAMGIAMADFDADGHRDVYVADLGPDSLWLANRCAAWSDATLARDIADLTAETISWGVAAFDVESDGDMDLFITTSLEGVDAMDQALCDEAPSPEDATPPPPAILLLNDGRGFFDRIDVDTHAPLDAYQALYYTLVSSGDVDEDGDVDLLVADKWGIRLLRNDTPQVGHRTAIRIVDPAGAPLRGARVTVHRDQGGSAFHDQWATSAMQGFSSTAYRVGLPADTEEIMVEVAWPGGGRTLHGPLPVDHSIRIVEGSVPQVDTVALHD